MESMDSRFRSAAEIGTAPRIAGEMSASPPEPLLSSPAVWKALACVGRLRPLLASRGVDGLLLFLVALAIRLPFQTTVLYHWDSVLYARALAGFDVSESRPHPPGYLLYVGAARLAQLVLHDASASLVAVSQLGGASLWSSSTYSRANSTGEPRRCWRRCCSRQRPPSGTTAAWPILTPCLPAAASDWPPWAWPTGVAPARPPLW